MSKDYFRLHVFCCINQRPNGHPRGSCAERGALSLRDYMKTRAKEMGLLGIRINSAGCLDRCELGPTVVVYPDGIWYHLETNKDVDEILDQHLKNGIIVQRLLLKAEK